MSQLTPAELVSLRSRPQSTKLWLSIYRPTVILSGQVNDNAIAPGEREITYDTPGGDFNNVRSGMTLLVGTAANAADVGRIRVKSATSSVITVAENFNINWKDNLHLTVLDFYEIWAIYPRYVLDANTGLVTVYKDFDVEYTNQNETLGSFVCMGSHYAGWDGDQVYYTATGTFNVNGQGLTYSWVFQGGTPGTSTDETPGLVTYNVPGHYTTRLEVTNSSGTVDIGYRHVSIYDRPEGGVEYPFLRWELDNPSGSREEGGYSFSIIVHEDIDPVLPAGPFADGALVIIFADEFYGDTKQSIGGNSQNRETVKFVGYIRDGTIRYDYQHSTVEFEVVSPTILMQEKETPSVSVDSSGNIAESAAENKDSKWYYVKNMNVTKALYHWFYWHSTILLCCDFRYTGTDYVFQYFETDPSSLYDSVNTFLQTALIGRLVADRQANLWAEIEPGAINNATGTLIEELDITKQDWMNEPEVVEIQHWPVSYLEMGGVAYSGDGTGTSVAYLSEAPGGVQSYWGKSEGQQGLILTSQGFLNTLTGNVFAYKNARYPEVTFEMSGNYSNYDIAPLSQIPITLKPEDNRRRLNWNRKPFHITDMEWEYDPSKQSFLPVITLHEITQGYAAQTVDIPDPEDPNNPPTVPPIIPPEFPIIPIGPPGIPPPTTPHPPTDDCQDLPNGPFVIPWAGEVHSLENPTAVFWADANPPCGGSFAHQIRDDAPTFGFPNYPTKMIIYGCWEQSDDGGSTWTAWTDAVHSGLAFATLYSRYWTGDYYFEDFVFMNDGTNRCEGREFQISQNPQGLMASDGKAPAQAYTFTISPQQILAGPSITTQFLTDGEASGCAPGGSFTSVFGDDLGRLTMTGDRFHAFGIWHMDMQNLSFPNGHLMITIRVLGKSGGDGGNPSIRQNVTTSNYPSGPTPSLSANTSSDELVAIGSTQVVTPSGSTSIVFSDGYFRLSIGDCTAYTADIEIINIEWREAVSGEVHPLWSPAWVDRLFRVNISKIELYNICSCEDFFES